jgi:hypothetical protein
VETKILLLLCLWHCDIFVRLFNPRKSARFWQIAWVQLRFCYPEKYRIGFRFLSMPLNVVRFTAEKEHSGLGSLSITAEWVALVYPVCKWLMITCSRLVILLVLLFIMWYGLRSFMVMVEFSHFFLLFLFVFFFYSCYQVLWGVSVWWISSFSASFAASSAAVYFI